jgi:transaldolase
MYVEQLIGPNTVNTMPPQTVDAFRDHGNVARTVDKDVDDAQATIDELAKHDISIDDVTAKLLVDGIASFQKSYDSLIAGLQTKTKALGKELVESH